MVYRHEPHGRIRGRKGVALRKARLAAEPLCRICKAEGKTTLATVPDHIRPLALGGTDTDDNVQCLCQPCHDLKTSLEGNSYAATNHPEWLEPSNIPVTIICGPPASGKTTYAQQYPNDIIIDLDAILSELDDGYKPWQGRTESALFNRGIRERNKRLGQLSRTSAGRAWFIVSAPSPRERQWWHDKLGGDIVLLDPGIDECKRRAMARNTPNAIAGIDKWYSCPPWEPNQQVVRTVTGTDGWPI